MSLDPQLYCTFSRKAIWLDLCCVQTLLRQTLIQALAEADQNPGKPVSDQRCPLGGQRGTSELEVPVNVKSDGNRARPAATQCSLLCLGSVPQIKEDTKGQRWSLFLIIR